MAITQTIMLKKRLVLINLLYFDLKNVRHAVKKERKEEFNLF